MTQPGLVGGLFRSFSETERVPNAVLKFATQYGHLGVRKLIAVDAPQETSGRKSFSMRWAEPLQSWFNEIDEMDRLVRAWDSGWTGVPTTRKIKQTVAHIADRLIYSWSTELGQGTEVLASQDLRPWLLERLLPLDSTKSIRRALRCYLQVAVNQKLKLNEVAVQLLWDRKDVELGLSMVPSTLAGFMWLQFATAIQGNVAHRRCEDCGHWFALGGRLGRSDKRFCSGTCKMRAHRKKT